MIVQLIWLILGGLVTGVWMGPLGSIESTRALLWFGALWTFCALNFWFLHQAVLSILRFSAFRALSWGLLKLVYLGVFGILMKSRIHQIPGVALFFGMATLLIVPLLNSIQWTRRGPTHA